MPEFFVLSVEDNSNDVLFLKWAFAKAGLRGSFQFVSSASAAKDYLLGIAPFDNRAKYPFPDLLLVDLKMPDTDGFQLLDWLRAQSFANRRPKAAVLTGSNRREDLERGHALGADFCLTKPMDIQELVAAIKCMVTEHSPESRRSSR